MYVSVFASQQIGSKGHKIYFECEHCRDEVIGGVDVQVKPGHGLFEGLHSIGSFCAYLVAIACITQDSKLSPCVFGL